MRRKNLALNKSDTATSYAGEDQAGSSSPELLLPEVVQTPEIELTEWGGRLLNRPYFPVYLANGRDGMLINLMGAGEGHWSGNMRSCYPLPKQLNPSWYRADRRVFEGCDLHYGHLLPFVDFSAGPLLHGDMLVPRDVRQYFDPCTATVTTLFEQFDNRTMQPLRLRIITFLTEEGLLVQMIDMLEVPDGGVNYFFTLSEPGADYLNAQVPFVKPSEPRFETGDDNNLLWYRSHWEQGKAVGFSLVGGSPVESVSERRERHPAHTQVRQVTGLCGQGDRLWRVLAIQDDYEGGEPEAVCEKLLHKARELGPDGLWQQHCEKWKEYFATSVVVLPDKTAQFLYDVSRYLIKANLHPDGFLPMGMLPYQWQGVAFWDGWFAQQAFLGCGNLAEADVILGHFHKLEAEGRALAAEHRSPGVRIEWTTGLREMNRYPEPNLQIHNNAVWAYGIMQQASFTGVEIPTERVAFAEELLSFVLDRVVSGRHGQAGFTGVDESENDPKPNDTWTLAITLKALESYEAYCTRAGLEKKIPDWGGAVEKLQKMLQDNTDSRGVLQSFHAGSLPHWGSLVFDLYPRAEQALPTLAAMSLNHDKTGDWFNFHGVNRYAERAFPWATNWAARCLGRMNRREALHYWLNNTRATNMFGGIPERIYYHNELYINWFMTGHASLLWAMNGMLAHYEDGVLSLLGGIDFDIWNTISFEGLHTENGLSVSLDVVDGKLASLYVHSLETSESAIRVVSKVLGMDRSVSLKPGTNKLG